jgi:linoleoyl-CoA desaturase
MPFSFDAVMLVDGAMFFFEEVLHSVHPLCYPLVPYWAIVSTLFFICPLTVILPMALRGKASWPRRKDFPDEWTIHGKRYNLKSFYDQHPGGEHMLRAAKCTDCTGLFESCHTFIDREVLLKMLDRFEIKDGVEGSKPVMVYSDPFYEDLKLMVREHFKGQKKYAHKMTDSHLALGFSVVVVYWYMIYKYMTEGSGSLLFLPIGLLSCYLTLNVMHDGSHNALFSRPWVNKLCAKAAFPFGVNVAGWTIQHVTSHHIYTNMEDHDVDLYHFEPVMHLKKGVGTVPIVLHCIRLFFLLSTSIVHLVLVVPLGLIFGHVDPAHGHAMYDRIKGIQCQRAELRWDIITEYVGFLGFMVFCCYHIGTLRALLLMTQVSTVSSFAFAFFTQVSHLQADCHPDSPEEWDALSFAKRQVKTSLDFSPESLFWGRISGGLNTQAIHHCFPSVSAMHLRALYPGFRKVCQKHGVELKEATSLGSFLWGFVHFSN